MNTDLNKLQYQLNQIEIIQEDSLNSSELGSSLATHQFHRVCRTCLTVGEYNQSIFDTKYEETEAAEILNRYVSVQVEEDDLLPQNICSTCLFDLFQMYNFIRKCVNSDTILRCTIESNDSPCTVKNLKHKVGVENCKSNAEDETRFEVKRKTKRVTLKRNIVKRKSRMAVMYNAQARLSLKCKDCNEVYNTTEDLRNHRKEANHLQERKHACKVCSKKFTGSKLRQHMRVHTKEKPYVCKVCDQAFSMSGNMKRHMMTHTGERPHVCEICGKGFIQATSLQNHKKTHIKAENLNGDSDAPCFICHSCGRSFKRLARYNSHIKRHLTGIEETKKETENSEPKEHVCMVCKRAYKTKHLLKAHQLTHGEKTFLCSDCGKGFVTKAALVSHFKVHTGEKPHVCNVCKKSFAHIGSFESHMLIHTGQKPYNCNLCTKSFTQHSHLKYHLRTHSGERPYMCSFCGKSFALKGNLTVHTRTHTGETPYICPVCGKGFYDSSSMKKHRRGHGEISTHTEVFSHLQINDKDIAIHNSNVIDVISNQNNMFA